MLSCQFPIKDVYNCSIYPVGEKFVISTYILNVCKCVKGDFSQKQRLRIYSRSSMLALVVGVLYLLGGQTVSANDATGSRFVCSAIPPGAEPGCPLGSPENRIQNTSPVEDELRNTIIQLRETILQQKETIVSQQGTIKELNCKRARGEEAADDSSKSRGKSSRRKEYNKNTMGDLPRDPTETIDQLGKTMQSLKGRLENLEVRAHNRVTSCMYTAHHFNEMLIFCYGQKGQFSHTSK